jgi:hypothetical protein
MILRCQITATFCGGFGEGLAKEVMGKEVINKYIK